MQKNLGEKSEFEKLERGLSSRDGVKSFYIILNMHIRSGTYL